MSILSSIFYKIFPSSHPAVINNSQLNTPQPVQTNAQTTMTTKTASVTPLKHIQDQNMIDGVDVEKMLDEKNLSAGQTLNWRSSIVDLLKLLDIDCSLQARNALAAELDYNGDTSDSAKMNTWLHRQVMNKLASNGGKVPTDLKD